MNIRVRLRTKKNSAGRDYLFAALPAVDSLLFIHPLSAPDQAGHTHELVFKPYTGKAPPARRPNGDPAEGAHEPDADDEYSGTWAEGDERKPTPSRRVA